MFNETDKSKDEDRVHRDYPQNLKYIENWDKENENKFNEDIVVIIGGSDKHSKRLVKLLYKRGLNRENKLIEMVTLNQDHNSFCHDFTFKLNAILEIIKSEALKRKAASAR